MSTKCYLNDWAVSLASFALVFVPWSLLTAATLPATPYRTSMALTRVYETVRDSSSDQEVQRLPTVTIKGRVRNVGFVDARFSLRRNKTWTSRISKHGLESPDTTVPVLLQGQLAVGGGWRYSGRRIFPAAASVINKTLKVTFPGRATGSKASRQRLYTITIRLDGSLVVRASVASIPKSAGRRGACGAAVGSGLPTKHAHSLGEEPILESDEETIRPLTALDTEATPQLSRVVTISTDADEEWYQRYGEQSNAVIASIVNSAEAIFHRQLGLRFRIVQQHAYASGSPYSTTNASRLLASFAMNPENRSNLGGGKATFHKDVDLKHLFTGKDLDGSTIGIAYIGAVCAFPSMAFGVTQAYMDIANAAVFAHELGHNFGANHDVSATEGLMYPAISLPPANNFSDVSLTEINSHLTHFGTCVSLEELVPLPEHTPAADPNVPQITSNTPTTISLNRKRVAYANRSAIRLSGKLLSSSENPLGSVGILLIVQGKEVGRAVTDRNGRFKFFVRIQTPRGRYVSVSVRTEGHEISSRELVFRGSIAA